LPWTSYMPCHHTTHQSPLTLYMEGYEFESQLHYQNSPSLILTWILSPLLPL
jgi:hypothetical protein